MTSKKTYALAMLAGSLLTSAAHAETSSTDLTADVSPSALSAASADTQAPAPSAEKTETSLQQTLESMPDWSKDLASRIKIHGYVQGGYTYTHNGEADDNTFELKRSLLWVNGQITDRWAFQFMHDFSSVVQEYYTDYRVTSNKALTIRLGQFKHAFSYENKLSPTNLETIDICSESVTYLAGCGSDPLFGVQYGRDLGLALFGETNNGKLRYEVNVLNGQGVNKKDSNPEKDFIGRIDVKPAKGLTIIATGQLGRGQAKAQSLYVPDIQIGENYKRNRWSAGFDYNIPAMHLHGEYLEGRDKNATSRGAYVTGCVPLIKDLDFVGSYDFFNFNVDRHMDQHKAVAGIQYWFYKNCRAQIQYVYKSASTLSGSFRHGANHAIMCQMQIRIN